MGQSDYPHLQRMVRSSVEAFPAQLLLADYSNGVASLDIPHDNPGGPYNPSGSHTPVEGNWSPHGYRMWVMRGHGELAPHP